MTEIRVLAPFARQWTSLQLGVERDDPNALLCGHFDKLLSDILLAENLIILCGLGTSLCVTTEGARAAPTMADLWTAAQDLTENFGRLKSTVHYNEPENGQNIEALLSQCQAALIFAPSQEVQDFVTRAESLIVQKCRFLRDNVPLLAHETFLRKVARRSVHLPRVKIFTTNYDLCFEEAAKRIRFLVVDGFAPVPEGEFDGGNFDYDFVRRKENRDLPEFASNVFHFYKLHGSVDWEQDDNGRIFRRPSAGRPLMIYPRSSKFEFSYTQPFLEMMSQFQLALRRPNLGILVIGFGFNDNHITQPLLSALRSNVGLKAVVVDPILEASPSAACLEIKRLIEGGDHRLALIAAKFEEFSSAVPDIGIADEQEIHSRRVQHGRPSQ